MKIMCRGEERRPSLQSLRTAARQTSMINPLFGSRSLKRDEVKAEELEPPSTHGSAHRRPRHSSGCRTNRVIGPR